MMRPRSPALPSSVVSTSVDAQVAEAVEVEQLRRAARAVEQRRRDAARAQRLGQRGERREADAAGDHPGFGRRIDERERPAERAEAGDALSPGRAS